MQETVKKQLMNITRVPIQWDCPLSDRTSFDIGGPATALVTVECEEELLEILGIFKENRVLWRCIGRGTNLLVADHGFDGAVVILGKGLSHLSIVSEKTSSVVVKAGCGVGLTKLSQYCIEKGLSGLEFAHGIPGTVGGAVVMNAGAWGEDISSVICSVKTVSTEGVRNWSKSELHFGYRCWRDLRKSKEQLIVTEVCLELVADDQRKMQEKCSEYRQQRMRNQPQRKPNAGSIFKNPASDSAGRLIEASGLKGKKVGGAMVSPLHANFIVNEGGATAEDVKTLMSLIQERVKADSGVELEPEIHCL